MKSLTLKIILAAACTLVVFCSLGLSDEQIVTGIDSDELFRKVLPPYRKGKAEVTEKGIVYTLNEPISSNRITVTLAVYEDVSAAKQAAGRESMMMSSPPVPTDTVFADDHYFWKSNVRGGSILLRWKNTIVDISASSVDFDVLVNLSREIITAFETSSRIAAKGSKVQVPKVKGVTLPASVPTSSKQIFSVEMEDQIMNENVLIGADQPNVVWEGGNRVAYHSLRNEGEDSFELVVATKNNVIAKTRVRVKSQGKGGK